MATYVYECGLHGQVEIEKPMDHSGEPEWCHECVKYADVNHRISASTPMRRIFTPQGFIMRPRGWNLRPGDKGAYDFRRELETGEVRSIGSRERYAETVKDDYVAPPVKVKYTEDQMYELTQLGRVVDRQIREEMPDLPSE